MSLKIMKLIQLLMRNSHVTHCQLSANNEHLLWFDATHVFTQKSIHWWRPSFTTRTIVSSRSYIWMWVLGDEAAFLAVLGTSLSHNMLLLSLHPSPLPLSSQVLWGGFWASHPYGSWWWFQHYQWNQCQWMIRWTHRRQCLIFLSAWNGHMTCHGKEQLLGDKQKGPDVPKKLLFFFSSFPFSFSA